MRNGKGPIILPLFEEISRPVVSSCLWLGFRTFAIQLCQWPLQPKDYTSRWTSRILLRSKFGKIEYSIVICYIMEDLHWEISEALHSPLMSKIKSLLAFANVTIFLTLATCLVVKQGKIWWNKLFSQQILFFVSQTWFHQPHKMSHVT